MGKTIIKGVKPDGTLDTEYITTPELITKLIKDLDKRDPVTKKELSDADIRHRLEDIRLASEQDERTRFAYAYGLKKNKERKDAEEAALDAFEKELVNGGIEAAKQCAEVHHDVKSMVAILKLCKAIGSDKFDVKCEP